MALVLPVACGVSAADIIAGVDFEGASQGVFDRNPDDYDPADGITVSSGSSGSVFDGWTLLLLDGNPGASGNLRNDAGANAAGATTPDYPARLEGGRTGSWSITIPPGVVLNLERIEFDVRGATNGTGRDGQFNTSLDGANYLWEDFDLPGRTTGNWQRISIDLGGAIYQNLTDQTVSFIWTTPGGAIDLDTIELYGAIGGQAPAVRLAISPGAGEPGNYDFEWTSRDGMVYDLVSEGALSSAPDTWPVWDGRAGIPASGTGSNRLSNVPVGDDPARFFAVVERVAPP